MGYGGARSKHSKAETSNYKDRRAAFVPLKPLPQSEKGFDHRSVPKSNVKAKLHSSPKDLDFSDAESSSSGSSSDEFIHVNPRIPPKSPTSRIPRPNHGPTKPFHMIEKVDVSSEALYRFEESLYDSPVSTSRFSDVTHESLALSLSPFQYPPVQLMERQGDFDPNRIPESVFERPSTPTEWSSTSNDSLFSIRIGNSSFSKNHVSTTNVDLCRSSEQPKSGEFSKSEEFHGYENQSEKHYEPGETYRSGESRTSDLKRPDHLIKTTAMVHSIEGVINMGVAKTWNEDSNTGAVNPIKYGPTAIMNNQIEEVSQDSRNYLRGNRIVDKRESAMQPSVITKTKKSSFPLCYSPNCSHICHFKRPSCSCKFPSCKSCLSCPSCWCKSCLGCPSCSCTSCLSCPSCSCRSCLSCPSCCYKSCFKWPSCSCKSCLRWPSCCCKSLRCPSCTCKCFKWTNCCSWKCFRWPKCSSKCIHCQSCSCKWSTCTGCCTCNLFRCECFKWPSCKFSCSSPSSCCSECCTCCCSKSKRRWFCFSYSCCNPCFSCNSC